MKSLLRLLISLLTVSFIFSFILLSTVRFQLTNPEFLIATLKKPETYTQLQKAIKYSFLNQIQSEIEKQGGSIEKLTVGERILLEKEAEKISEIASPEKIQSFTETNIKRILAYINGENDKLLLFLPLQDWGIYESLEEPGTYEPIFTENTDVLSLIEKGNNKSGLTKERVVSIHNLSQKIERFWLINAGIVFVLLILHYFVSSRKIKILSTANLLAFSGALILLISITLRYFSERLVRSSPYLKDPTQILIGTIAPPFIFEITKIWVIEGIVLLLFSLSIFAFVSFYTKRKAKYFETADKKPIK